MKNHTLKLPLDLTKRHFVVGDIHGRLEMFERLLKSADYDPENDIVYAVGDMIDRGSFSVEVLEFFDMEKAFSIRGNHEVMATSEDWYVVWMNNGGIQTLDSMKANAVDLKWLHAMIERLPYIIDVGEDGEEHAFRIVHAEIPPGWDEQTFQFVLDSSENDDDSRFAHCLWARTTIEQARQNVANMKPSHYDITFHPERSGRNIFVGHTPIRSVMKVGDMTYLDTWASRTLSMVEAISGQVWSVPFKESEFI